MLDFRCEVILPQDLPKSFRDPILQFNPSAQIIDSLNKNEYIKGAVDKLREEIEGNPSIYCLNHSRDKRTLEATAEIANEVIEQLDSVFGVTQLDYYIVACGNGSTIIGPARRLKETFPGLQVRGFEPKEAPVVSTYLSTTCFDGITGSRHSLYGTGVWGVQFPFLFEEEHRVREFLPSASHIFQIDEERKQRIRRLVTRTGGQFGFTSLASIAIAEEMAAREEAKNFLLLLYDRGAKYDGLDL